MSKIIIQAVQNFGYCFVIFLALFFAYKLYRFYSKKINEIKKFKFSLKSGEFGNDGLDQKFREICLNFEEFSDKINNKLILKTEPKTYLINFVRDEFEKSYLYKSSGVFTGVALVLTFLLIGFSVHDIGINLPTIDKKNLNLLGNPIAELQQKFYVSITGIICTLLYQYYSSKLLQKLSSIAHQELNLRDKINYIVRESQDLQYQQTQAIGADGTYKNSGRLVDLIELSSQNSKKDLDEVKVLLTNLTNIKVTVESFAENVIAKLEDSINQSVGIKLQELIQAQNNSTEKIANQIGEVLSKSIGTELEKAFSELSSKLPNIMSNGAGEATSRMADAITQASSAFQSVSSSMPILVTQMTSMLKQIEAQQGSNNEVSQKVQSDLMKNVHDATQLMNTQNAKSIEQQAEIVRALQDTITDLNKNVRTTSQEMQDSMKNGAGNFSEKVESASHGISQSLGGMTLVLTEVDKLVAILTASNKQLLAEFNNSIIELKNVATSVASSNMSLSNTISSLSSLSKDLNHAPILTQTLVENTSNALNDQQRNIEKMLTDMSQRTEFMSKSLADQYSRGVEMVAKTFVEKIGEIEGHTKNIRGVYSAAGQALTTSLEPLESLSENIQELNRSIKSLPNLKNT